MRFKLSNDKTSVSFITILAAIIMLKLSLYIT